jgi:Carbonic anhydrase
MVASVLSCNPGSSHDAKNTNRDSGSVPPAAVSVRPVHWSYHEEGGPAGWGKLSPVYSLCGSGQSQSPINLLGNARKGTPEWKVDYKTTTLHISHNEQVDELINNGHTIQVTTQSGSSISYHGKVYRLKQFHFHTPSEHTVDGQHAPMEIHLLHQADDLTLAVIGVFVREGKHNSNFDQLIKYLPNAPGETKTYDSVTIDISIHVPKNLKAYHYVGSLTTPPCSENVQWLVLRDPIEMSRSQLAAFSTRLKNNNRPTQNVNERMVTLDDVPAGN